MLKAFIKQCATRWSYFGVVQTNEHKGRSTEQFNMGPTLFTSREAGI